MSAPRSTTRLAIRRSQRSGMPLTTNWDLMLFQDTPAQASIKMITQMVQRKISMSPSATRMMMAHPPVTSILKTTSPRRLLLQAAPQLLLSTLRTLSFLQPALTLLASPTLLLLLPLLLLMVSQSPCRPVHGSTMRLELLMAPPTSMSLSL